MTTKEKIVAWWGEKTTKAGLGGLLYALAAYVSTGSINAEMFPNAPTAKSAVIASVLLVVMKGRKIGMFGSNGSDGSGGPDQQSFPSIKL